MDSDLKNHDLFFILVDTVYHNNKLYYRLDVPAKLNWWITSTKHQDDWVWNSNSHDGTSWIDVSEDLYLLLSLKCRKYTYVL